MRRTVIVCLSLSVLMALAMAVPAVAQGILVTAEGAADPGETVTVSCPPHHYFESGQVTFYPSARSPRQIATLALTPTAEGQAATGGTAVAPRGAHYYRAQYGCQPIITMYDFTGRIEAGQTLTILCPPAEPYMRAASPTIFFADSGESGILYQERVRDETGQPIGVTFTASEPGTWNLTLHCSAAPNPDPPS
jgi:hypothetical protein